MPDRAARILTTTLALVGVATLAACSAIHPRAPAKLPRADPKRSADDFREARVTRFVQPEFPEEATRWGWECIVVLEVTISAEGDVTGVEVVRTEPSEGTPDDGLVRPIGSDRDAAEAMAIAAADAVWKWEFSPALENGRPVESTKSVPLQFTQNR